MSRPDPAALAVWHALDVCDAIAGDRPGSPLLVLDEGGVVRWPAGVAIASGTPVVELLVQSDAVLVVSTLRRALAPIDVVLVRFPMRGGVGFSPDPAAIFSADWWQGLASVVDVALALLPAPGQALAGP